MGFDKYMDLVLDDARKVHIKNRTRKTLGWILLKGETTSHRYSRNSNGSIRHTPRRMPDVFRR